MNYRPCVFKIVGTMALLGLAATCLLADVIETKNGARLVGKVGAADGTVVILSTEYAGDIKVKQSEIVSITTETPINVRLQGGTVMQGNILGTGAGALTVTGPDGTITTTVDKVAATWAPGTKDPAIAALERGWIYEAAADVTGKTGNKEQLGTSVSLRATLKSAQDVLQFYSAYDRQVTDQEKSADQFKAGLDYQNYFSRRSSWYVRDEGGFDRVKDIELYNIAAAGLGYDFIKKARQTLTARVGVSYRYEGYRNPLTEDVKSAGLDVGLNHRYDGETWSLVNRLAYIPAFEDFGTYRAMHESFFEIPMVNPRWKLRLGVSNDYNSEPGPGVDELDTTYFGRFVLTWK